MKTLTKKSVSRRNFLTGTATIAGLAEVIPPSDYKTIDKEWNAWEPRSPGARSFKETVDAIEALAKAHADNLSFGA